MATITSCSDAMQLKACCSRADSTASAWLLLLLLPYSIGGCRRVAEPPSALFAAMRHDHVPLWTVVVLMQVRRAVHLQRDTVCASYDVRRLRMLPCAPGPCLLAARPHRLCFWAPAAVLHSCC